MVEGPLTAADYAPAACRPPPGTPDGAVCWVRHGFHGMCAGRWQADTPGQWPDCWRFPGATISVARMTKLGWRFHAVADVPVATGGAK